MDNDSKDEIVILLTTGTSTGYHIEDIHILNIEDLTELSIEDPLQVINKMVSSSINIKDDKVNITINWNENTFNKSFDKSYAGWWFDRISFGNVIHYEIENNKIIAKVLGQMSPTGFPVTAIVEYDENLKVIKIEIEDK